MRFSLKDFVIVIMCVGFLVGFFVGFIGKRLGEFGSLILPILIVPSLGAAIGSLLFKTKLGFWLGVFCVFIWLLLAGIIGEFQTDPRLD